MINRLIEFTLMIQTPSLLSFLLAQIGYHISNTTFGLQLASYYQSNTLFFNQGDIIDLQTDWYSLNKHILLGIKNLNVSTFISEYNAMHHRYS